MSRDFGDNGKLNNMGTTSEPSLDLKKEVEKSVETLLKEKKEAFERDPGQFVEMKDIIACMVRIPGGVSHYIGPAKRSEYNMTKSELQYQIDKILREMDSMKKSKIINPFAKKSGGFGKKRF